MSFLYLSEQSHSCPDNNLFSCSLGLMNSHLHLNCSINTHNKSMRYYKTYQQLLQGIDLTIKLKRHAFNRIQQCSRIPHHHHPAASYFVPEELAKGNGRIIPAFLNQLKQQKVDSYIKLKVSHFKDTYRTRIKMHSVLSKIFNRRLALAIRSIIVQAEYTPVSGNILEGLLTEGSQPTPPSKTSQAVKRVEISYTRVYYEFGQRQKYRRKNRSVEQSRPNSHITELVKRGKYRRKRYLFESVDSAWQRVKL